MAKQQSYWTGKYAGSRTAERELTSAANDGSCEISTLHWADPIVTSNKHHPIFFIPFFQFDDLDIFKSPKTEIKHNCGIFYHIFYAKYVFEVMKLRETK